MSLSPSSLFLLKPLAMKPVPSPPIDCRFRVYGCHTRLSREAMEQHMVTATNVHLHLLLSKLTDLERSSRSLDRRVTEMEIRGRKHSSLASASWHTTTIPSMIMMSNEGQHEAIKELSLHATIPSVPSYASMTSLSSVASEDDSIKTDGESRKRRREEEDELDSDDDDSSSSQGSPAYGAHVHESLIQVASMAQSIPPTWSTDRSSRPVTVTAAALRRRAARRLKRQRALLEGPGVPKKPKTAYNYFQSESRKQIQQEVARLGPHLTREERSQQVARVIGERWKALTEEQRIPYQTLADQDKERYREACQQQNMEPLNVDVSESPISTASMSSGSPISPHSPVSPILSGSSAFHRASPSSVA